jgi:hypothetical protein
VGHLMNPFFDVDRGLDPQLINIKSEIKKIIFFTIRLN